VYLRVVGNGFYGKGLFSVTFIVGIECFVGLGFCCSLLRNAMGGRRCFFMGMYSCCFDNFIELYTENPVFVIVTKNNDNEHTAGLMVCL
jgi:hypothetical protein